RPVCVVDRKQRPTLRRVADRIASADRPSIVDARRHSCRTIMGKIVHRSLLVGGLSKRRCNPHVPRFLGVLECPHFCQQIPPSAAKNCSGYRELPIHGSRKAFLVCGRKPWPVQAVRRSVAANSLCALIDEPAKPTRFIQRDTRAFL